MISKDITNTYKDYVQDEIICNMDRHPSLALPSDSGTKEHRYSIQLHLSSTCKIEVSRSIDFIIDYGGIVRYSCFR